MQAGNAHYIKPSDLPDVLPVFPLSGALLLPGGRLPLNIFEPRYLELIDQVVASHRLIGMVQPRNESDSSDSPALYEVGCVGRLTSLAESGDGRYLISLHGVCRYRIAEEVRVKTPYRQCRIVAFAADLAESDDGENVDREALLKTFRAYLDANELEADWESVSRAENETLVNALSMMAPYGPAEKQALLEAVDLKTRADTLVAITEIALAREGDEFGPGLQ